MASFQQELSNMQRVKWCLLGWVVLSLVSDVEMVIDCCGNKKSVFEKAICCLGEVDQLLQGEGDAINALKQLEIFLERPTFTETTSISSSNVVTIFVNSRDIEIYANDTTALADEVVPNNKVSVRLPRTLDTGPKNTIVFSMLKLPEKKAANITSTELYEGRLVGLKVQCKIISGLQERVNITFDLSVADTQNPLCVFLNFSIRGYSPDGCRTVWERGQNKITCSCDHLTYFGVLLVSATLPPEDVEVLSYITLVGCSLSLVSLVITVLIFIIDRQVKEDMSMKVHINLAAALILLNAHFLPTQAVAALSSNALCFYVALVLHYSTLATFSWMALEGFHLYLLLVKVFNIYFNRYLLKLSVVGWGVPAVIVSVVAVIDTDAYGRVPLDSSNSNDTLICYIANDVIKTATTLGVFGMVFLFNMTILWVTVRRVVSLRHSSERSLGRAKREICTVLGVTVLLGITWGLAFFSFGYLTTPGLYLFSILNSLQGFFIFLWFVLSLRKMKNSSQDKHLKHNTSG